MRWSEEQIQRARNVDVADFLRRYEGHELVRSGRYLKCKNPVAGEPSSLTVDTKINRIFYNAETGNRPLTAIDWCVEIKHMDFNEAMAAILDESPRENSEHGGFRQFRARPDKEEKAEFAAPERADSTEQVRQYLTRTRGLPEYLVDECLECGILYQDTHANAVFAGFDEKGTMRYAATRGTGEIPWKRDAKGSDKAYAFCLEGSSSDTVFVTEAAVDALSVATIYDKIHGKDAHKAVTFLSTGGAGIIKALERFTQTHTVKTVNVCYDSDQAGRNGLEKIKQQYGAAGYTVNDKLPTHGKDYNEELIALNGNPNLYAPPAAKEYLEQYGAKIKQNESEDRAFKKQLERFLNGEMPSHEVVNICSTPYILKLFNSTAKKVVINQAELTNALTQEGQSSNHHTETHGIGEGEMRRLSEAIRRPLLVLKGNASNPNSLLLVTDMVDSKNESVLVPIALDRQNGKVSVVSTLYGKKNLSDYLLSHLSSILAVNKKIETNLFADTGNQYPQSICKTVVRFYDDSIAYTTASVKYPEQNFTELSQNGVPSSKREQTEVQQCAAHPAQPQGGETMPTQETQARLPERLEQCAKAAAESVHAFCQENNLTANGRDMYYVKQNPEYGSFAIHGVRDTGTSQFLEVSGFKPKGKDDFVYTVEVGGFSQRDEKGHIAKTPMRDYKGTLPDPMLQAAAVCAENLGVRLDSEILPEAQMQTCMEQAKASLRESGHGQFYVKPNFEHNSFMITGTKESGTSQFVEVSGFIPKDKSDYAHAVMVGDFSKRDENRRVEKVPLRDYKGTLPDPMLQAAKECAQKLNVRTEPWRGFSRDTLKQKAREKSQQKSEPRKDIKEQSL